MEITTACLVFRDRTPNGLVYRCHSLGDYDISSRNPYYSAAIRELKHQLGKMLKNVTYTENQSVVKRFLVDESWTSSTVDLKLLLPDRTVKARLPFSIQPFGNQFLARCPAIDSMNLIVSHLDFLKDEAERVVPRWIQKQKHWRDMDWSYLLFPRDHWWDTFDIQYVPIKPRSWKFFFIGMGGTESSKGVHHLQEIGRCLDDEDRDPPTVLGRESETEQIFKILAAKKRQAVALIGDSGVGKTTIIREVVRQRLEMTNRPKYKQRVWAINSQRIVTGMMYVGQWEDRWLSILDEIYRRDHVLYIEDPIGLLTAGITRDSDHSAADLLISFAAVRPIRLLTELTPKALGILRLRRRELADMFLSVKVEPMDSKQTMDIVIERMGDLGVRRQRFFHPAGLPLLISSIDRYQRKQAFPGKVTDLMEDLSKQQNSSVAGPDILRGIERRTGLRLTNRKLTYSRLEEQIKSRVIGQDAAIDRILKYILRSNAGISPDDRPMGVFLCLGPTGVGKTETAKAIAQVLFDGHEHLIRFDMNEINSTAAAEQLIGNFEQPDGKLTSAVRRTPFSILLFDEIEKAHPDVFDYLLQVIGEGRLTDAIGRTIDFRDTLIFMTSNLGAREAERAIGFEPNDQLAREHYVKAAAAFFRPEFINRLDDIIMFRHLSKRDIERIAVIQAGKLVERDGIRRRRITMRISPDALDWLVQRGYDPQLGARVLKREVERFIAQPVADRLAESCDDSFQLILVDRHRDQLRTQVIALPLQQAKQLAMPPIEQTLRDSQGTIDELAKTCEKLRQKINPKAQGSLETSQYYTLREQVDHCRELRQQLQLSYQNQSSPSNSRTDAKAKLPKMKTPKSNLRNAGAHNKFYQRQSNASDEIQDYLDGDPLVDSLDDPTSLQSALATELEFAMCLSENYGNSDDLVVYLRCLAGDLSNPSLRHHIETLFYDRLPSLLRESFGFVVNYPEEQQPQAGKRHNVHQLNGPDGIANYLMVTGLGAGPLCKAFEGLVVADDGRFLLRLGSFPVSAPDGNIRAVVAEQLKQLCSQPDPVFDEYTDAVQPSQKLRALCKIDPELDQTEIVNSDGLGTVPTYHLESETLHEILKDPRRRVALDWLFVDRLEKEVQS